MKKILSLLFVVLVTHYASAQSSQTVNCYSAGNLSSLVSSSSGITNLTITGYIDARDFVVISSMQQLQSLDLSGVAIQSYYGYDGTQSGYNSYSSNELPYFAFKNNSTGQNPYNLKNIKLPATLTSLGNYALVNCDVTNITIPSGVTSIGTYAFYACYNLTSISIPNSVTTIGDNAFYYCSNLTNFTIGSSVTSLGTSVFGDCTKLTKFIVQAANPNYSSVDSVLYNKNQTTVIQCPQGKVGAYTMPNTVTTISDYAFMNCSKITGSIILPNSVTTIGSSSFSGCTGITGTFTFGSGLTTIGANPFYNCTGITDFAITTGSTKFEVSGGVLFNKNLTTLVKYPLGKLGSYTIPSSVTAIGNYAFNYCQNLTGDMVIPNTVTTIGESAFYSCTGLNGNLTIGSGVSSIGQSAFSYCNNIKVINCLKTTPPTTASEAFYFSVYPTVYTPTAAAATAYKAATGWTSFTTIVAPGFTTSTASILGLNYAPGATTSDSKYFTISGGFLTDNITINAPTNFELSTTSGDAFSPKTSLTLNQIGGMVALDTIYVRMKTGLSANTYTQNLSISSTGITTQNLSVSGIVRTTPELVNVTTAGTLSSILSLSEKVAITKLKVTGSIDVRDINCMRDEMTLLADLDLSEANIMAYGGNTANELPRYSFYYQYPISKGKTSLTTIKLPNSLTSIAESAFQSCSVLTSITFGSSLSSIGNYAFNDCNGLKIINSLNETPPTLSESTFGWSNNYSINVSVPTATAVTSYKANSMWNKFQIYSAGISTSSISVAGLNYVPNSGPSDAKLLTVAGGMLTSDMVITVPTNFEISTSPAPSFSGLSSLTLTPAYGVIGLDSIYVRLKTSLPLNSYNGNLTIATTGYSTLTIPLTGIVRNIPDSINVTTVGTLSASLSATEKSAITKLKLTGNIDARDFKCIRDELSGLTDLNLSGVNIVGYNGMEDGTYVYNSWETPNSYTYTAKTLPPYAFNNKKMLRTIVLPTVIDAIGLNAFSGCDVKIYSSTITPPIGTISNIGLSNSIVYVPTGKVDVYKTAWGTGTNVLIIDQDVEVTVNVTVAGKLATTIFNQTAFHPSLITKLTVTGVLGETDITYIRDNMKICYDVNLEGVNLTALPASAFSGRSFLFSVKLPSNLKTIGSSAFYNVSDLKSIDLPTNLTTINENAFYGCSSLSSINTPTSVTSIGDYAFQSCTGLQSATINGTTSISDGVFYGCSGLKSATFNGATSIGSSAFGGCSSLKNATFNGVTSIGSYAFYNCTGLTATTFNGATTFGSSSFYQCSNLPTLAVSGVSSIADNAFKSCSKLISITLDRVSTIGSSAFQDCDLKTVTISGATSIGSYAFSGCYNITYMDIPSTVTSIGVAAFQSCSKMDSVSIGAKVATIGANAFSGCSNLSRITAYRLTPATLGLNVFGSVNTQTCKLRILQDADFDAYFSAAQWGSFLNVERMNLTGKMGDSNEDGAINIVDVANVVNYILEKPVVKFNLMYSDINKDGNINVIDVVQLVKLISSAPSPAPAFRVKGDEQSNTAYYNVEQGIFSTYMPGGLRGFDITYTGSLSNLPALEGFAVSAYTKNGVQHLLGYTMDKAIANAEFTQLFRLNESATINEMTFVNDNGSQVVMVKGTTTDLQNIAVKGSMLIENGQIRWTAADELLSLALYNSNGSLVTSSLTTTLHLPTNVKGVYILQVKTKQGNSSRKIVL